ncbi:MAG: UDP-N-acetylmuramate--L-alanine ligase [Defluviitaleaceae bacterium]|nr:UDP-N-acetylmuramate--L-alanine ligase [Defluviitaleaceae bacterium]
MGKINIIQGHTNFHFIGIGGIHMSGLAEILHLDGCYVTGSDKNDSENVARLRKVGIDVKIGHDAQNIPKNAQVVVYNAAISENNPEIALARAKNLHIMGRAELLGRLMQNYDQAICVAGTHGKTTTTSMLATIFMVADTDPTVLNGGILPAMGGAMRIGGRRVFIAEACEYHDSFLNFFPHIGIILNMEMDHSDFFPDIHALGRSFHKFARRIPGDGLLIIDGQIDGLPQIIDGLDCNIQILGKNGHIWAENVHFDASGCGIFDVFDKSGVLGRINMAVPGNHNIQNALAATTCALRFGIDFAVISRALGSFTGTRRRFQVVGQCNGATVVDDYAHHPTEITATLQAARNIPHGRLWAVFQPHTHTRTRQFLSAFADSLATADEVIILDIYKPAGREEAGCHIHARDLANQISLQMPNCRYLSSFDKAIDYLKNHVQPNDMIIAMGAGDIDTLAHKLGLC